MEGKRDGLYLSMEEFQGLRSSATATSTDSPEADKRGAAPWPCA